MTNAHTRQEWLERVGSVVEQCLAAGFRYGPVRRMWVDGALRVGAYWTKGRREPFRALRRKLDGVGAKWPVPCASCSPFVEVVLRLLYGWKRPQVKMISRSTSRALKKLPELAAVARDAHRKRYRVFDFATLPDELPEPLCLALYRGHVVLVVDCDQVPVRDLRPGTAERYYTGRRVIGADGSFRDVEDARGKTLRRYSCQPLRWESVEARAHRQRHHSDRYRKIALVGLAPPAPKRWPPEPPRLVVH